MKLIKTSTGKINVRATLLAMEVGEVLSLRDDQINLDYTRGCASKLSRSDNMTFEVSSPRDLKGKIIITRTA